MAKQSFKDLVLGSAGTKRVKNIVRRKKGKWAKDSDEKWLKRVSKKASLW
jgi:hypothetical protein